MAESSKAGSSKYSGAGTDNDQLLEKMLYGADTDIMDLDDLEEAFKDNEVANDDNPEWFSDDNAESDNEITQVYNAK